jgi:hypothetical protein
MLVCSNDYVARLTQNLVSLSAWVAPDLSNAFNLVPSLQESGLMLRSSLQEPLG